MKTKAYAKINITLDIPKIRDDGYHELCSVFSTVSLYDELDITVSDTNEENEILLTCNEPTVPCDNKNLCWKAVEAFTEKYGIKNKKICIHLIKNIPSGAGLGGGSSDCAETLKVLNKLLEINVSDEELEQIGVKLGADVPFFIKGGTQLAEGIGEKLTQLSIDYPEVHLVIIKPKAELLTKNIYKIFDGLPKEKLPKASTEIFLNEIAKGNVNAFKLTTNMLEPAAKTLCYEVGEAENILLENGAISAMMTGSGSAVFGIFTNVNKAAEALEAAKNNNKIIFGTTCRFI